MTVQIAAKPAPVATTLEFDGRFGFGIDQWAYVPFDVPPGVRRIVVSTTHDHFSLLGVARNVLDLGIFGPAGHELGNAKGFRGWSGGARTGFTVAESGATAGYLAGPIDPGRWTLALGPVVLNPAGMRWRAEVELHYSDSEPTPAQAAPLGGQQPKSAGRPGWYRGDLHVHTVHSDGRLPLGGVVDGAQAAGLDFIVSTDHNTNSANRAWAEHDTGGLLVVPGEEVTTRHGHWLAVALPRHGWVDWRYGLRDEHFARYAADVQAGGGLVVAAHPAVPLPGSAWEFGSDGVDAIEVWNGRWNVDDEVSLRIWLRLLRNCRRITAVGSSDSHGLHQPIGRPHTVVHADDLSTASLVAALRQGRCYLAGAQQVAVSLTAWRAVGDAPMTALPGETMVVPADQPVTVTAAIAGAPNTTAAIRTDAGRVARTAIDDGGTGMVQWTGTSAQTSFALVEVRQAARTRLRPMVALTKPIWLRKTAAHHSEVV